MDWLVIAPENPPPMRANRMNDYSSSGEMAACCRFMGMRGDEFCRFMASCRFSSNFRSAPKGRPEDITDICVYRNMRYRFSTSEVIEERLPAPAML